MENCIFCKIANGEIPAATLYEDENFRVILDLGPASKGHALILPKSHAANIYELSDEMAAKAMILAKKMATAMTAALKCDGFNIVQNNGECAGQTGFRDIKEIRWESHGTRVNSVMQIKKKSC